MAQIPPELQKLLNTQQMPPELQNLLSSTSTTSSKTPDKIISTELPKDVQSQLNQLQLTYGSTLGTTSTGYVPKTFSQLSEEKKTKNQEQAQFIRDSYATTATPEPEVDPNASWYDTYVKNLQSMPGNEVDALKAMEKPVTERGAVSNILNSAFDSALASLFGIVGTATDTDGMTSSSGNPAQSMWGNELEGFDYADNFNNYLQGVSDAAYSEADKLTTSAGEAQTIAKENTGLLGSLGVDLGIAATQLGTDIAIAAATGGSVLAPMAVRSFGSGSNEARQNGGTYADQLAYGAATAAVEVLTEKISSVGMPLQNMPQGTLDDIITKTIENMASTSTGRVALTTIAGAVSEGGEEVISSLVNPVLQAMTFDENALSQYGEVDYWGEVLSSGLIGGALGAPGGAISGINQYYNNTTENVETTEAVTEAEPEAIAEAENVGTTYNALIQEAITSAESSGTIPNSTANKILKDETALNELLEITGKQLPTTASQQRAFVKSELLNLANTQQNTVDETADVVTEAGEGVAEISENTLYDEIVPQIYEPTTQPTTEETSTIGQIDLYNAETMPTLSNAETVGTQSGTVTPTQENTQTSVINSVADKMADTEQAAVFRAMYDGVQEPSQYYEQFIRAYNAGKNGQAESSVIANAYNPFVAKAAYNAGVASARSNTKTNTQSTSQTSTTDTSAVEANTTSSKVYTTGDKGTAYSTPQNKINFTYAVMSANDLVTSNDELGKVNVNYPSELQPRDRSRTESQNQISTISKNLNPELLSESSTAQNGTPVVTKDGIVVGGNARSQAIKLAYEKGRAGNYTQYLVDNAAKFGIDATALPADAVLVRIVDDNTDLIELSRELNKTTTASYSSSEQASTDAKKIGEVILKLVPREDGDITTAENYAFVSSFTQKIVSGEEKNQMFTRDGELSIYGKNRITNAIVAYAFDNNSLLEKISEDTDPDAKNVLKSLIRVAPTLASVKAQIENGSLEDVGVTDLIINSLELYTQSRAENIAVDNLWNQQTLFDNQSEEVLWLAQFLENNKNSAKKIRTMLFSILEANTNLGNPEQTNLFGTENNLKNVLESADDIYGQQNNSTDSKRKTNSTDTTASASGKDVQTKDYKFSKSAKSTDTTKTKTEVKQSKQTKQSKKSTKSSKGNSGQWTTKRVGDTNVEISSLTDIISQMEHDLDIPIYQGKTSRKEVLGQYNTRYETIRTKIANDLPTIAHEIGHHIDQIYNITNSEMKENAEVTSELIYKGDVDFLSMYPIEEQASEAFAEFMREYLTNSEEATLKYPKTVEFLKKKLVSGDMAMLEHFADITNAHLAYSAQSVGSSVKLAGEKSKDYRTLTERIQDSASTTYQAWVDSIYSIKRFDKATDSKTYIAASNAAYINDRAYGQVNYSVTDLNGDPVNESLKSALSEINTKDTKEYKDFGDYLVVKHGVERLANGLQVFANPVKDNESWMLEQQQKYEEQYPKFKETSERIYKYQQSILKVYLVDTGVISQKTADEWLTRWEYYVPFNRDVNTKFSNNASNKAFANQNNPIKRAKGSGLDIIHPVDNILENTVKMVRAGMLNDVMRQITNEAKTAQGIGYMLEKEPSPPKNVAKVNTDKLKEELEDLVVGLGLDENATSDVLDIIVDIDDVLKQYSNGKAYGDVITVMKNGKPEYWKINDPLLLESITSLTPNKIHPVMEAYGKVSRYMSANLTALNIIWTVASNAPKDVETMVTYAGIGGFNDLLQLLTNIGSAYVNMLKGDNAEPVFNEFFANGAGNTSAYVSETADMSKRLRRSISGQKSLNPLDWLEFISTMVELGPRYAYYKLLRQRGYLQQEAFYLSNDITVNFRRGGTISKGINNFVPFFNVSVQSIDKFGRWVTAADIPTDGRSKAVKSRVAWLTTSSLIISAIFHALNSRDDEAKEDYARLSSYTKNTYWNIPLGDGKFIAIPKARELAILSSFFERTFEYVLNDNEYAFDGFYDYYTNNALPKLVSEMATLDWGNLIGSFGILGAGAQLYANKDFLGNPIVSATFDGNVMPKDAFTGRTSIMAKAVGEAFNVAPQQVDFFMKSMLGGWWKNATALLPVDSSERDLTLGVGSTYVKDSLYSTDIANKLYDDSKTATEERGSHSGDMEYEIPYKEYSNMTTFYSRYNTLQKEDLDSEMSRQVRELVLGMVDDFNRNTTAGHQTDEQAFVNQYVTAVGDTSLLPRVMTTTIDIGEEEKYGFTAQEYVEYQTSYLGFYWANIDNLMDNVGGKTEDYIVAGIKAAHTSALADAKATAQNSLGYSTDRYSDIETRASLGIDTSVQALYDEALTKYDKDGNNYYTIAETTAALDSLELTKEQKAYLWVAEHPTSKNNPYL